MLPNVVSVTKTSPLQGQSSEPQSKEKYNKQETWKFHENLVFKQLQQFKNMDQGR